MLRMPAFRVYGPARNIPEWWIFNGRAKTINENKGSGAKTIVASSARLSTNRPMQLDVLRPASEMNLTTKN
ncbi:hypothetical protein HYE67_005654 [Fusarium culmorum]|uniref:Uncharacterized protein n=1 Tax=Fusarium culmorum TaxID=5516 RepID=A0A2T4GDY5_FUSCU|nr:hypothetical protein FCULG_00010589 [Fusarium culmorum]QPC63423.1 hypothetical protein HYE67_005654 [Fusarium culmorum]